MSKIDRPGVYQISMPAYHGDACIGPSISSSGLRRIFSESPAHFWDKSYLNPKRTEEADKEAFVLGRAAHHLLLGEDAFSTLFIMRPAELGGEPWQGNRKVCRAWLKEQERDGRTVLTPAQIETIRGMARSLASNELVRAGILNGRIEQSIIWKDAETGVWLKSRPDALSGDSGDFCDLKTASSVTWDDMRRSIAEWGYHQQAALLAEGYEIVVGRKMTSFSFCFVEKTSPFCVRIVTLKDCDLDRGRRQNRWAIREFAHCLETGKWPGPGGDVDDAAWIEMSEWAQKSIDDRLVFLGMHK